MTRTDPYTPDEARYECLECGDRVRTDGSPGTCPTCGVELTNISVPRE